MYWHFDRWGTSAAAVVRGGAAVCMHRNESYVCVTQPPPRRCVRWRLHFPRTRVVQSNQGVGWCAMNGNIPVEQQRQDTDDQRPSVRRAT